MSTFQGGGSSFSIFGLQFGWISALFSPSSSEVLVASKYSTRREEIDGRKNSRPTAGRNPKSFDFQVFALSRPFAVAFDQMGFVCSFGNSLALAG